MLDAEISPTGTVLVEGHHVGELQGFRFTADQAANGEDGKALRAAAQKALATEFEARAERFSACPNGDIALGSDGVLRWIGAPIGTLAAGEDALKPRVILFADEQLTGPARDKVAARAERFVNFQIESLLKPLVDLKNAEQIVGIGRGIAFRLVEEFGLINRRDIAEDVKTLDQSGRAALRRLGVRFGAYHIFVPALIKPAPAGLITLLWSLKNDGKDKPGFGDVVNALASGRTSVVVDAAFDRAFYKLAGFRPLGRRAVRVDILERLADFIRPALAWRAGTGTRPDGAFDGQAFMVTPAMMSILGANSEDMEEILKGLGYRSEAKPATEVKAKLEALDQAAREAAAKAEAEKAAKAVAEAEAATASEEAQSALEMTEASAEGAASPEGDAGLPAAESDLVETPDTGGASDEAAPLEAATWAPAVEQAPVSAPIAAALPAQASEESAGIAAAPVHDGDSATPGETAAPGETETAAPEQLPDAAKQDASTGSDTPAEEPKPILLWRPGRFDRPAGGRRHDGRPRHGRGPQADGGSAGERTQGRRPPFQGRRDDNNEGKAGDGKPRFDRKKDRPEGGRPDGQRDGGRPDFRKGKRDESRGNRDQKQSFQPRPPRDERPAKIDPLSPFAKLAALRDQLKK